MTLTSLDYTQIPHHLRVVLNPMTSVTNVFSNTRPFEFNLESLSCILDISGEMNVSVGLLHLNKKCVTQVDLNQATDGKY